MNLLKFVKNINENNFNGNNFEDISQKLSTRANIKIGLTKHKINGTDSEILHFFVNIF